MAIAVLIAAERGLSQFQMADVALRARMSTSSVYNHFRDVHDLRFEVVLEVARRLEEYVFCSHPMAEDLPAPQLWAACVRWLENYPRMPLLTDALPATLQDGVRRIEANYRKEVARLVDAWSRFFHRHLDAASVTHSKAHAFQLTCLLLSMPWLVRVLGLEKARLHLARTLHDYLRGTLGLRLKALGDGPILFTGVSGPIGWPDRVWERAVLHEPPDEVTEEPIGGCLFSPDPSSSAGPQAEWPPRTG